MWYAIADVASFVRPGGAIDQSCHIRGQTIYLPDGKSPLHPAAFSEGSGSLLPGQNRAAVLWRLDLGADASIRSADVRRARVRSRAQLTYEEVQRAVGGGTADGTVALLAEVGRKRLDLESARGGVSLPIPEQEVVPAGRAYRLEFRSPLPAEAWNAQISLMTGMAAASIMLEGGVGILRVMPPAPPENLAELRRVAAGLSLAWPAGMSYGEMVRSLDPGLPAADAFLQAAVSLFRGAGYAPFDGEPPLDAAHAAVAAPNTHVTAPLRRLVDRYATEVALALCSGEAIPEWVRIALPDLPKTMEGTGRRARNAERAAVDLVEAAVLHDRVGEVFDAVVINVTGTGGTVQLRDPAVRARCEGSGLPLGSAIQVRLARADPETRQITFEPA